MPEAALASWNDGPSQSAIVAFVKRVTAEGGPDFVPPDERIAEKSLELAKSDGWTVVSIKNDWNTVFA